ncbi:MAG: hypothetical protein KC586_11270 [Myxococcales bacterium]|nr:hypothetical protein [Myxococcales bacterium]
MRIERLRRAIEADPDDVDARVRLVEEVDALGPPWSTYGLLVELAGSAPRGVRAWAHRRLAARAVATTGERARAFWHAWNAQLASGRSDGAVARSWRDEDRFAFVTARPPTPFDHTDGYVASVERSWLVGGSRLELRRLRPTEWLGDELVLVAVDGAGREMRIDEVGMDWGEAGRTDATTIEHARLQRVEGRVQLVLEGEVWATDYDACWRSERRDRFTAVCEPPNEGRPGGRVRLTRPGLGSWGRHHDFPERSCPPGPTIREVGPNELGVVEVGERGVRWRGPTSPPYFRRWRSWDALRVGAPPTPREPPGGAALLEGPLPPRLPIDPPNEIKVEVRVSTPEEALRVFERLFEDTNE